MSARGGSVGDALLPPPDGRAIAFPGSTAVGEPIASLTARQMKKLHLELGGKDPFVIADDAPLDEAVEALTYAALINAGQVCTSTERVYVPGTMISEFVEVIADRVSQLRIGPGIDPTTEVGPTASEAGRTTRP